MEGRADFRYAENRSRVKLTSKTEATNSSASLKVASTPEQRFLHLNGLNTKTNMSAVT